MSHKNKSLNIPAWRCVGEVVLHLLSSCALCSNFVTLVVTTSKASSGEGFRHNPNKSECFCPTDWCMHTILAERDICSLQVLDLLPERKCQRWSWGLSSDLQLALNSSGCVRTSRRQSWWCWSAESCDPSHSSFLIQLTARSLNVMSAHCEIAIKSVINKW